MMMIGHNGVNDWIELSSTLTKGNTRIYLFCVLTYIIRLVGWKVGLWCVVAVSFIGGENRNVSGDRY